MADENMLQLPVASSVDGSEYAWIVQGGTDKRTTLEDIANATAAKIPTGGGFGQVLIKASNANFDTTWATVTGVGTVTSVALALPISVFAISGSPVTAAGTLTGTFQTQTANTIFAGPTTGGAVAPAFRAIVPADVTLAQGGTGAALTASNGGIFYSGASAGAILAGVAAANRALLSGNSAAPSWSTATYPATAAAGTMLAAATLNAISATPTPTLGVAGSLLGTISLAGNTSGTATIRPQAAAGTPTITLPTASGTIAVTASAPLVLNATTGALTITGAALTKTDDTNVTLTLGGTPASALVAATSLTLGWTGQLGAARGGTGLAAITAHNLIIGNGTGTAVLLAPSATSGVPLISQGSAADPAYGTAVVAGGGTGNATATAYSVICGGTTSTGAFQAAAIGTAGRVLMDNGASALPTFQALSTSITFIIDGGGSAITTGIKGDLTIPFGYTITEWTLLGDQSGSIVVDIWSDAYSAYPPTGADSITASAKPTISTATKGQSSTLTGWTTVIAAGGTLRFNVDSITSLTRCTLSLKVNRTSA